MKKFVVANWKANKNAQTAQQWLEDLATNTIDVSENLELIVAPPFPLLPVFLDLDPAHPVLSKISLATQDISPFAAGSYTGAVASENLAEFSISFAIVGHSERRRYFHESYQDVANKVTQCLQNGITPIVCVDDEYIAEQAAALASDQLSRCIVAYEELGAIGSGNNESPEHVGEIVQRIKVVFGEVPVLYGGSVSPSNIQEYLPITDGVLVGGASLDAEKFASLITATNNFIVS